ncbi:hypothetical protein SAMN04515674_102102 [Pseudarcicella hirudinis]|uniref:Uncharacterized protein n=2 Tax=Pseudarcicella hirudinis TaxID=1079859 RepID=A0A1I5NTB0_9BACT|nr:hypothetical protein SAMN04515674_102102 [Pseudarcicella hirudinis]
MKTSNKIIVGLMSFILIMMFTTTLLLKAEYKKRLNLKIDEYSNLLNEKVGGFSEVKILGHKTYPVFVQSSSSYGLKVSEEMKSNKAFRYVVKDSVLTIDFSNGDSDPGDVNSNDRTAIVVLCPKLKEVTFSGVRGRVKGLTVSDLSVNVRNKATALFYRNTIGNIKISSDTIDSAVEIYKGNKIDNLTLDMQAHGGSFLADNVLFKSLKMNVSDSIEVTLKGKSLGFLRSRQ